MYFYQFFHKERKEIKIMLFALCFLYFNIQKKYFIFINVENCGCNLRVHQSVQRVRGQLAGNLDCRQSETNKPMQLLKCKFEGP